MSEKNKIQLFLRSLCETGTERHLRYIYSIIDSVPALSKTDRHEVGSDTEFLHFKHAQKTAFFGHDSPLISIGYTQGQYGDAMLGSLSVGAFCAARAPTLGQVPVGDD